MNTPEIVCPKCLHLLDPTKLAAGCCPNCGERQAFTATNPSLAGRHQPPPLPVPPDLSRRRINIPLILAWIGVGILVLLLVRPLGGRVRPIAFLTIALLLAGSYAALTPVVRNPFGRLSGALYLVLGVIALILGVLYGGCVLIMKVFPS
jgi:hypothetical protein